MTSSSESRLHALKSISSAPHQLSMSLTSYTVNVLVNVNVPDEEFNHMYTKGNLCAIPLLVHTFTITSTFTYILHLQVCPTTYNYIYKYYYKYSTCIPNEMLFYFVCVHCRCYQMSYPTYQMMYTM